MRQVFYLILSLLVLQMFFPDVGGRLESALTAFLDMAQAVFQQAATAA